MKAFDDFVAQADHAMVIVTVADGDQQHGCLVGFHSQVSIEPRRYLVCLSHENATYRAARSAPHLAVHLLGADDSALASRFGEETADDGVDKFAGCPWRRVDVGTPVLEGVAAWFVGTVTNIVVMGDHSGFILEPLEAAVLRSADPLRLGQVSDFDAGH